METKRLHAIVRGVVQGVGFRYFVLRHAQTLALVGHVANRPDGSVELVAEGRQDDLRRLLERLREGPTGSVVRNLDVTWEEATGTCDGFRVSS